MSHDAETLRAEIADAFAAREYPGDDRIANIIPGCSDYEGNEAREWLRGKTWQQILEEGMGIEHRDYLIFLRPEGFLYFFPAFATFALDINHPAEMDDSVVHKLECFPEDIEALLAPQEFRAIVHLLEYLADAYDREDDVFNDARRALASYWSAFSDDKFLDEYLAALADDKPA